MPPTSDHPGQNEPSTSDGKKRAAHIPDEQWETHRELLRQWIMVDKLLFKDISARMKKDYSFPATEAQYRIKFREWGYFKNNKRPRPAEPEHPRHRRRPEAPNETHQSDTSGGSSPLHDPTVEIPPAPQPQMSGVQHVVDRAESFEPPNHVTMNQPFSSANQVDNPAANQAFQPTGNFQSSESLSETIGYGASANFESFDPVAPLLDYGPGSIEPCFSSHDSVDNFHHSGSTARHGYNSPFQTSRNQVAHSSNFSGLAQTPFLQTFPQVPYSTIVPPSFSQPYGTQPRLMQQQSSAQSNSYAKVFQRSAFPPVQINNNPGGATTAQAESHHSNYVGSSNKVRQPIHQAAQAGSFRGVELLLQTAPECAHVLGSDGVSAVLLAAQIGDIKIVQLLIEKGVDLNTSTIEHKQTALHQAAAGGHLEVVKLLLENKAEADPKDDTNLTPLWCAAQGGFHKIVKILLDKGADPNVTSFDGSRRPLHQAAQNGHAEVVRLLLATGAEADEEDAQNITPLWSAAQQGYHIIVKMLLDTKTTKFNVEVASKDGSRRPMHQAAQNGHAKVVELLLKYGARADPEKDMYEDKIPSPLWLAAQIGSVEVAKQLIDKNSNVNFPVSPSLRRPLHQAAQSGHTEIVRLLIERRADLNAGEEDGWPPMMIAAQQGYSEIVQLLLEAGADVDAEEKDGATSLWIASQQGHVEVVGKLLDNGAKSFSTRSAERRPIHQAAQNGHLEVVKRLIEHDPKELDIEEKKGWRPLTFASQKNEASYFEMMEFLIKKGAKPVS